MSSSPFDTIAENVRHMPTAFKTWGRSLHPLQRHGTVSPGGFPVVPPGMTRGFGGMAPAAATNIPNPPVLVTVGALPTRMLHNLI